MKSFALRCRPALALCALLLVVSPALAADPPYTQTEDLVFHNAYGIALPMDVFEPTGDKNGIAIIDIASGSWYSDRGKIRDHKLARVYDHGCAAGFTIFAVRPGSQTNFTAAEMVANVKRAIRYVKAHADDYGIDPNRVGLTGASAGGHLATLTAATAEAGDPDAKDDLEKLDTSVAAVLAFFPPTDFLAWAGEDADLKLLRSGMIGRIFFHGGVTDQTDEEIREAVTAVSPVRQVTSQFPPTLLIHGDADPLVPLAQSELLKTTLQEHGVQVELIVKPGGGHPWLTIAEEVKIGVDWFEKQLVN